MRLAWWQIIIAFIAGALLGQRFTHLHPLTPDY